MIIGAVEQPISTLKAVDMPKLVASSIVVVQKVTAATKSLMAANRGSFLLSREESCFTMLLMQNS